MARFAQGFRTTATSNAVIEFIGAALLGRGEFVGEVIAIRAVEKAFALADEHDLIIITGSFYTAGEAKRLLDERT